MIKAKLDFGNEQFLISCLRIPRFINWRLPCLQRKSITVPLLRTIWAHDLGAVKQNKSFGNLAPFAKKGGETYSSKSQFQFGILTSKGEVFALGSNLIRAPNL